MVTLLHGELMAALQHPTVRARLMDEGGNVVGSTPEQFAAYIRSETAKWTKLVKDAGIRAE
jgi:tripartite-type tricarboxylate transporter receptor subunit TctC